MPTQTISVLLRCERQEFQRAQAVAAVQAGEKEGVAVEASFAENSPVTQIQQVLACAKRPELERPLAIVIEFVGAPDGYRTAARAALSAGIAWIEVSGSAPSIPILRAEFPDRFVMSVTTDEVEIGRIHARQCRALLPSGGDLIYVEGPSLQPEVKARRRGLEEGLRGTATTIVKTLAGNWTAESAAKAAEALLGRSSGQHLSPALVCGQNDEMAIAVRQVALARHPEWKQIPFLGCDGLATGGERWVKEGALAATVRKPVTTGLAVIRALEGARRGAKPADLSLSPESVPALAALDLAGRRA